MNFERHTVIAVPFEDALARTRVALTAQGFGVLTEIDMQAVLWEKRGVAIEPYRILGACHPDLAHRALEADSSVGVLLPCSVVVRAGDDGTTVQIFDPQIITSLVASPALVPVARDASRRLDAVLSSLGGA